MKDLIKSLRMIADREDINVGEKAIEQKQRNTIKRDLTDTLYAILAEACAGIDEVKVYRTDGGIMFGLDNLKAGIIPIELTLAVKNMDCDPAEAEDAYRDKLAAAADKAKRAAEAKAAKIARSQAERELKAKLKALKDNPEVEGNDVEANDVEANDTELE